MGTYSGAVRRVRLKGKGMQGMTLTLNRETEARLRLVAEGRGLDPQQLHEDLLRQALAEAEAEQEKEQRETLAGLDESVEAFAAGRWITPDELDQRLTARAATARQSGTARP